MLKQLILSGTLFLSIYSLGQDKKKIDHTTYDEWNSIRTVALSASGVLAIYEVAPLEGDATLFVQNSSTGKTVAFARGKQAAILEDENVIVFLVEPEFDSLRKLKLAETPKDKLPKDSLFIYSIKDDSLIKFPGIKSVQVSETSPYIVFSHSKDKRPDCPANQKKREKKKNPCVKNPTSGTTLSLYNTTTNTKRDFHCVTNYQLSKDGQSLLYVKSHKGTKDTLSLVLYRISDSTEIILLDKQYGITQIAFDNQSNQFAFLSSNDTNKLKNYALYYSDKGANQPKCIVDSLTPGMPSDWTVSEFGKVYFSQDGKKLFFGSNKIVRQEPKDTLLDNEVAKVDVWGTNDGRLQPQQLVELQRDKRKTYLAVFFPAENRMVQVGSAELPNVSINPLSETAVCLGYNETKYHRESTWEYPWKSDYYLVNLISGQHKLILEGQGFRTSLSPSGDYLLYYNGSDSSWYSIDTKSGATKNISAVTKDLFAMDNNGNPSLADDQGFNGWTVIKGEEYAIVNARFDIWLLNSSTPEKSICLTKQKGKNDQTTYSYYRMDEDSLYSTLENNFVIGVDYLTKSESVYAISNADFNLKKLLVTNHRITLISKAEKSDSLLLRRMNFTEYPDLERTDLSFNSIHKITNINPQQELYNWGTVELVDWTSYKGKKLRGLLYKPEDFDSTQSYPMIVYFYEKYTDDLHVYYAPRPTASIVHPTEYVSNGYIIFIPDILYEPGYPANGAYDCIVSGTDYLIHKFNWIDSTRLGLQGQSWGGYQTAQLITMTGKYKAAMAGAPVSNMISAYGGIRWGSGYSRMFQYEKTQSRIGYTIWERPDLYIANSPLFGLPKVTTPLLIMSNDNDGAVPWYQGIELYMGLRRLNKPVWMLNYNGDEHNLMMNANRRDLSIRMRQFFDHYLLGAPMPVWMSTGVPAIDKGKTFGFELEKTGN
jgi:dipeptidyl aminopeptidase/acylaminoacyl peptidase